MPSGTGITLPGVACEILLEPTAFLGSVAGVSNNSIAFVIPADPGLVDVEFHAQVLAVPASGPVRVSNISGMKLW